MFGCLHLKTSLSAMSLSDVFSYEALVHAVAGTAGGSAAMTVFYPLDAVRTIIQVGTSKGEGLIEIITRMMREEGTISSSAAWPLIPFVSSVILIFLLKLSQYRFFSIFRCHFEGPHPNSSNYGSSLFASPCIFSKRPQSKNIHAC